MNSNEPVRYKVAEAARLAGVSASTLRLWESQGLVVPSRSETGHRQYNADDVARLKRISWFRAERGLNPAAIREALETEDAATLERMVESRPFSRASAASSGLCGTPRAKRWNRSPPRWG